MLNKDKKCGNCNHERSSDQFDWCEVTGKRKYFPEVCEKHEYKCVGCNYEKECDQETTCKRGVFWDKKEGV